MTEKREMPPPAPHEGPPRGLVAGVSSRACGSEPLSGAPAAGQQGHGRLSGGTRTVFWTFPGNGLLGNYGGDPERDANMLYWK